MERMALIPNAMNYSGSMASSQVSQVPHNNVMDKFLSNLLQAIGQSELEPPYEPPCDLISSNIRHAMGKLDDLSLSESPQTSSSAGSLTCSKCDDRPISSRCLECRETYCHDCLSVPSFDCCTKEHTIVPAGQHSPAAMRPPGLPAPPGLPPLLNQPRDLTCETHCETIRYYCSTCANIVCQECTLWEHKDHVTILIQDAIEASKVKVQKSFESGKLGTKFIKQSIDKAVVISRSVERDAVQVTVKIRKAMRHFILAIEERERQLLEKVSKMRQLKLSELSDQMHGLRNALSGLAQTNDYLCKVLESDGVEMLVAKDKADSQIELYANMYKSLQPKDEGLFFVPPNFELVMELKKLGDVMPTIYNANNKVLASSNGASTPIPIPAPSLEFGDLQRAVKRPTPIAPLHKGFIPTTPNAMAGLIQNPSAADKNIRKGTGQCIPGSLAPVVAKQSRSPLPSLPTITFGTDGQGDGQVSRPWGLCVDKEGNIIVADRRNNRIQVFSPEGMFKLTFGTKGTAPGEFDLPAGITTDVLGRIVVVDKDNHRVQIFTPTGGLVLTFGTYGKGCGQFRYPWDVAINSERQMVITDSRNYRIQLFNSEGVFITMLMFDGINHSRMLKGLTTPRGVCFTPMGDIIISDFENHRLLLIDSTLTSILGAKGYEGLAIGEFSRPSGIICDDEGRIIVADSKNQRVIVFSPCLEFLWALEVKGTGPEENDRPTDVGLTPEGRLVVIVEGLPDARETNTPGKTFVQIF